MKIYLAHPITTQNNKSRQNLKFLKQQITDAGHTYIDPESYGLDDKIDYIGIVKRNKSDILNSDIIILDLRFFSVGVSMELLFANMNNITTVCIVNNEESPLSAWIRHNSSIVTTEDKIGAVLKYYAD